MFRPAFTAGEAWSAPLPEASPAPSGGAVEGAGQGSAPLLETSPAPWGFPPTCTADRDRSPVPR